MNELLPTDRVQAGEKVYLQGKAPVRPALMSEKPIKVTMAVQVTQEKYLMHVVETKETLYAISKKYGVSIDDIIKWNNLQGLDLKKGQELKIYR
jgi:LysM repeat protein